MRNFTRRSRYLLCVISLFHWPLLLPAQSYTGNIKFENISIKDGLSQSSPNCIMQDSRGLLWIGTEDGLNRFDGYNFQIYKPDPNDSFSISHSRILCLFEDRSGDLWIGTNGGGLNRMDRKTEQFHAYTDNNKGGSVLPGNIVRCLVRTSENEIWIGTDHGIAVLLEETGSILDSDSGRDALYLLKDTGIRTMMTDSSGNVWIAAESGLYQVNPGTGAVLRGLSEIDGGLSLIENPVNALLTDRDGNLWIGTEGGLAKLSKGADAAEMVDPVVEGGNMRDIFPVRALYEDEQDHIWIGTFGGGLCIYQPESGRFLQYTYQYSNPYSLSNNEILSIYGDHSGIVWIGSNGMDRYNPRKEKFVLYDYVPYSEENLIFRNIHPIYEDRQGWLWIGSKGDGLHILDRTNQTYSRMLHEDGNPNSLPSNRIRALLEEPVNVMWVGTDDQGLCKVILDENRRPVRFIPYLSNREDPSTLSGNTIYDLLPDGSGRLWIGTDNGLSVMDMEAETFKRYLPDDSDPFSLSNTTAYCIYRDREGIIWIATDLGVNRYDEARDGFVRYVHDESDSTSLIHNEILAFHEDGEGYLWIGTYGYGIDRLDKSNGTFRHFSHVDELAKAVVYGILEDDEGCLWLSTNNGIMHFDPVTEQVKVFRVEDGLQSNEFNGTSYYRSAYGEMFFGGQYGFNSFYPEDVIIDSTAPEIILSDLLVNNVSIAPGENAPISVHISEANEIRLSYRENNFTLYFSALHFANPSLNQYKYKLEGFDDEWIDAGTKRFVTYTNLPYKTYLFRVIASNSDGVWNEEGLGVKIRVRPPFWATLWFRVVMVMLLAVLVFFLYKRRMHAAETQKQALKEKYEESDHNLQEAKDQLARQNEEIIIQKQELKLRERDQQELLWFNQGIGAFSEIITKNRGDMQGLCQAVINKLVDFLEAQQGGIFLVTDQNGTEPWLEMMASFGYDEQKINGRFQPGEGYVGACYAEKQFIEVDNLSEDYAMLHSGLGRQVLRHLLMAPLKVGDTCIGVIELCSFRKIMGYKVAFVEKMTENLASNIQTERANAKMKAIIEEAEKQAVQLREREDQLQMQLEENMAIKEEDERLDKEMKKALADAQSKEEELVRQIESLQARLGEFQKNDRPVKKGN